jgi:hypothetical protein
MKSFKSLRQNIQEVAYAAPFDMMGTRGRVGPQDSDNALDGTDINLSSLSNAAIARINTYLGAMCAKPYIDPVAAIKQAQGRLQMIGLDLEIPKDFAEAASMGNCEKMIPMVRFGGTYGLDGTSYDPQKTDGITPMLGHGLALRVAMNRTMNGLTQVHAQIVPSA